MDFLTSQFNIKNEENNRIRDASLVIVSKYDNETLEKTEKVQAFEDLESVNARSISQKEASSSADILLSHLDEDANYTSSFNEKLA